MLEKQISFIGKWGWNILRGSFFWLVGNLIYLFLLLNVSLAESFNEVGTLLMTGIAFIPFIFAPGTVAAFACVRLFDDDSREISWQRFSRAYKGNYQIAMKHGLVYVSSFSVLAVASWYYGSFHVLGKWLPLLLLFFATVLFLFVLIYTSDREENFWDYWKNGGLLLLNHPIFCFLMGTEIIFVLYFSHYIGALLLFVAPGVILLIVTYFYGEISRIELSKIHKVSD